MTNSNSEIAHHEGDSKRKTIVMILGLIILLGLLLVGSYVVSGYLGDPEHSSDTGGVLEGPIWMLESLNEHELIPGSTITAQFQDGQVGGSAGCNNYFASYVVEGDHITIGPAGSTMMFCEGIMEQETDYLTALGQAATYRIHDGELELIDDSGHTILTYTASSAE